MIGKEIKKKRRKLKITQAELAERTGLNSSDISSHERTRRDIRKVNYYHNEVLKDFFKE